MEIKISEIPPEGSTVSFVEEPGDIEGLDDDVSLPAPVSAKFSIRKSGATVYLNGSVRAILEMSCSRCGKRFRSGVISDFTLDLNPEEAAAEEEKELRPGDMETESYKGDVIDLSGLVREQVILQVPMKPLCMEECRGLCQYCGKDLNEGECGCEPPAGHPGLAGLKDLLKDKG